MSKKKSLTEINKQKNEPSINYNANYFTNVNGQTIKIARSGLGLPKKLYFTNNQYSKHYVDLMVLVAKLLGFTCNETDPENNVTAQMYSIFQFEKGIAEIKEKSIKLTNLIKLQADVPNFDWKDYFNSILPDSYRLSQNEQILAPDADYLNSVTNLMNVTDKRLLSRYILWHMLNDKLDFLSRGFKDANIQYYKNIFGLKDPEQWRTCIRLTNQNIGLPLDAKFIQKYVKDEKITKIKEMFDKFKKVFKTQNLDQKWLDQITRNHINEKVDAMIAKIGYPSYLKDNKYINWHYENLTFNKSTPFLNKLKIDSFNRYQLFKKLNYPINKTEWDVQPQHVGAVYKQISNQIVIPAGLLQPPIFQVGKVPSSLNYGSIGSIIGHELIHGFDSRGKDSWSSNSSKQFQNKSICFEEQFSKFKVGNHTLNGTLLLREIIADTEGSKLSYAAYKDYLSNNRDIVLPKLNYTNEQLFFIGFAQGFCIISTPEAEYYSSLISSHPPWDLRIIGTLSNSKDFAKVFRCREKAKEKQRFYMDPLQKCGIW